MPLPLSEVRSFFPHTQNQIYLNHAAISPYSTHVVAALESFIRQRHLEEIENYFFMLPRITDLRQRLATYVGAASSDQIAFTSNTSAGLNLLATGLDWQPGDRILLNSLEFPANIYPFLNLQRQGVEIDFVEPVHHQIRFEDIEAKIQPRTRLLSISQVQFLTGQRVDLHALGQLCRDHQILFSVDAIQALGATQLDVQAMNIDFLASGGHKWLMGASGQGFVYIAPNLLERLSSAMVGWLSVDDSWNLLDYQLKLRSDAARFEMGSFNALGLTALLAAMEVFAIWPTEEITAQVLELSGFLIQGLCSMGLEVITPADPASRLGIVTCLHPDADFLRQALELRNIKISAREGKYLRFAPHFYNTRDELIQTLGVLKELLQPPKKSFQLW